MEYTNVALPKTLATAIEKISPVLGYRSISEFVVEAVRFHLRLKEFEADRRLLDMKEKEKEKYADFTE